MSNASGSLNSLASSSVIDLGMNRRSGTPAQQLSRSRHMTLVWGVVLGLLGLAPWGHVLEAGLTIASITYGGLLGVFLLGTWNRRANRDWRAGWLRRRNCGDDRRQIPDAARVHLVRARGNDRDVRRGLAREPADRQVT